MVLATKAIKVLNKISVEQIFMGKGLVLKQDWKSGRHPMGPSVPAYDPQPPDESDAFKLANYQMQITKIKEDPTKKSWERFSFRLDPETRARWVNDPVYGPEWRNLLADFDSKLLCKTNNDPFLWGNHCSWVLTSTITVDS